MKRTGKHIWFFCTLICVFSFNTAVAQKIWSEVSVNRSSVVIGQPVEVSVSLYTSTWFTTGINPGNIQVNGAFTVYFRAVSNVKKIDQKTYAGVTLIFNVFPYEDGEMIFPALTLDVESPKEGDFKGIARKINTKEKAINVKPIPPGYNPEEWLVTSNLSVRESWSGNRTQVKVGDVLVRTINRTATGTVAELIPPIIWDTLSNVGLYPGNSNFENLKTKTSINSTRSESVQYLFEREGEVVLPEMEITWWNPYKNKLYKRTLEEVKIDVLPNPDLGILASIKDSLALLNTPEELPEESKTPFLILGYTVKEFLSRVLIAFIIVFILFKFIKWIIPNLKSRYNNYLSSEIYYFRKFLSTVRSNSLQESTQALYVWIDQLDLKEPTLHNFVNNFGSEQMIFEISEIEKALKTNNGSMKIEVKEWKKARRNYLNKLKSSTQNSRPNWINP